MGAFGKLMIRTMGGDINHYEGNIKSSKDDSECPICGKEDAQIFEACNECGYNPCNNDK